ncbi:MAG: hypothetical protein ABI474_09455 [Actinomycetota bacterium]
MFVQPSGLIFLVIIAIWAAYLLQHWVRRREHLATARSVDRFSDAMRVLERRIPLPESDLSLPQPRSYSVSPARSSRPEVVVKRAQPQTPTVRERPAAPSHSVGLFHALARMPMRRVRGLSFLASLSLAVVVSVLAGFSVLAWWSVLIAVATLAATVASLRHAAVAERAAHRPGLPARASTVAPVRSASAGAVARTAARGEPVVAPTADGAADLSELGETAAATEAVSPAEVDLTGWAPVPVPPPTYTLKAKAERPAPVATAATAPTTPQPSSFDGVVDEGELDDLLDRRRAAGA